VANDPMQQFEIKKIFDLPKIGNVDVSFTNSSLYMVISVALVVAFFALTLKKNLVPGRMQSLGEMSYEFIANMLRDTTGPEAMKFFPFVFTIFFFVLFSNLVGMFPYAFTTTSPVLSGLRFSRRQDCPCRCIFLSSQLRLFHSCHAR